MASLEKLKIIKRDSAKVDYEIDKVINAVLKAMRAVGHNEPDLANRIALVVTQNITARFVPPAIPTVEDIQDEVETQLIRDGLNDAAKAYILYRKEHDDIRTAKRFFDVADDLKLSVNAVKVLGERYLLKDALGRIAESPSEMFMRVAEHVASVDDLYHGSQNSTETKNEFFKAMRNLEFLPNSPTLMNAGTKLGQLAACFVLPIEDSLESIFESVKRMALIHQSGGGTGFSFSKLRPKGDLVKSTKGVASGPVSFMKVFDVATEVVKQGGKRRGANMAILDTTHPDIVEFITAKRQPGVFTNFNFSVSVTDSFMRALRDGSEIQLRHPRTDEIVATHRAEDIFDLISAAAWETGDPGMVFIDRINRDNPTPTIGQLEATNPCSEQPLLANESCVLGSINLSKITETGKVDWEHLRDIVRIGVHFLDNVIDVSRYIFPEIEQITKANRKIGLGIMGFADCLINLKIPYDSEKAIETGGQIMKFISEEGRKASAELAKERGSFPNYSVSIWPKIGFKSMRNATVTTIAPTGTISIIANCSSGIEPVFGVSFIRRVLEGSKLIEVNPVFKKIACERGFYSKSLMYEIAKHGSLRKIMAIPKDVQRIIPVASDIDPIWHVKMQACFQQYTDNATSKTVNMRKNASIEDVRNVFLAAYDLGCKGITVYRYGSKPEQVLSYAEDESYLEVSEEYAGGCPGEQCSF